MNHNLVDINNVLVIGCGGAGLRAAIEAKLNGLQVSILGKRSKKDSHTVLAAGGINAAFGNIDPNDNWRYHFADTYLEGYELGDPELIERMCIESPYYVEEIDKWGANFKKLDNNKFDQRYFGAHKYRRTCYSGDYTGQSILNALLRKSLSLKIPIHDSQYVAELLVKDNKCFGAMSFNIITGERTAHFADAVILCTGGHTRIWKNSTSREYENTGDGFHLGLKAGCELSDMEMVQFHPTGTVLPTATRGTLVTEAVRGEGGLLLNSKGERFMAKYDSKRLELSTRDRVAMANYTEIIEGRGTENGGVFLDISHKSKEFILEKIPNIYRQFIENSLIDISKEPMEVSPTAHYSMGGLKVNALDHSTRIEGLFSAGEAASGLHGANRLGGNSLAEILIFGAHAGRAAAKLSKALSSQLRSRKCISETHDYLNHSISKGNENVYLLKSELRDLMWDYCGVIRNEKSLIKGINRINDLESFLPNTDIRLEFNNQNDLINKLDLHSSLITAKVTLLSALERKESRGAHQRSDFQKTEDACKFNINILMKGDKFIIKRSNHKSVNQELINHIERSEREEEIAKKLLE
ncbi:FAD-binding protein [Prochlorococcus marinus]|uniref:FAD-binding protein n=1 Tax=Prochlorococcus marinus TaxID=1219 RepID=UPI001ADAA427|nr:FAD-binding protein [Prochlorococcus marinus]MBO8219535.1 FAD-binding protein [Prochlorococcus marinus CUG1416]MBW3051906.1 succinate dehydrogenase [Prochlorococcus marinus str. MU1416]